MSIAGYATMPVVPEVAKNFRAELERQTNAQFTAAGRRGGQAYGDAAAREAGGRIRSRFSGIFREAIAPAAGVLAGTGLVEGLHQVVDAGSEAQQSLGGVQAVFKKYADEVVRDSKRAEQGLGLSRTAYQELATVTGALLKNQGIKDFTEQTEFLIERGADLAATIGGPTRDAVEALTAAMRGESDPIERYGISLNETAVNAVLAANGQSKLTGAQLQTAKAQARLLLIQQQSTDAAGAFAREADTQAGAAARTTAQWQNMTAELGRNLLPATQAFTGFLNRDALPALNATGGVVKDVTQAVDDLPGPLKQVAAGFLALKAAQAIGLGGAAQAGANRLRSVLDGARLRAMLLVDAYRDVRQGQAGVASESGRFVSGVDRMSAALGGLRAAGTGAGSGLARGLRGALSLVGGPWGAAFIAGTAIVTHFWQAHQDAERRVQDFTSTLDEETAAVTKNTRQWVARQLQAKDVLKVANGLGFSLPRVTDAILDQGEGFASLNRELQRRVDLGTSIDAAGSFIQTDEAQAAQQLLTALNDLHGTQAKAVSGQKLVAAAAAETTTATTKTTAATQAYTTQLQNARSAVQALLNKENERRNRLLGRAQDELALAEALTAARKEAKDGARTLDISTEAGQANQRALLDLASTWNNAADAVKRSKGAYSDFRERFIKIADSMGASREQAQRLANRLLQLPSNKAINVTTPGMEAALANVRRLREEARLANLIRIQVFANQAEKNRNELQRRAGGGPIWGPGTKTSDSVLVAASNGEYMQPASAVDYYGMAFMEAVRRRQIPRYADGGPIGSSRGTAATVVTPSGQEIRGTLRFQRDGTMFLEGVAQAVYDDNQRSARSAKRMSALDGRRRH